jgi:hypothetical protein
VVLCDFFVQSVTLQCASSLPESQLVLRSHSRTSSLVEVRVAGFLPAVVWESGGIPLVVTCRDSGMLLLLVDTSTTAPSFGCRGC